jgi:hypothetical protein
LLKLARLDAGTTAIKNEPVDMRRLIERALEAHAFQEDPKNLS